MHQKLVGFTLSQTTVASSLWESKVQHSAVLAGNALVCFLGRVLY